MIPRIIQKPQEIQHATPADSIPKLLFIIDNLIETLPEEEFFGYVKNLIQELDVIDQEQSETIIATLVEYFQNINSIDEDQKSVLQHQLQNYILSLKEQEEKERNEEEKEAENLLSDINNL